MLETIYLDVNDHFKTGIVTRLSQKVMSFSLI